MGQASRPDAEYSIFCDEATSQMAKSQVNFKMLPPVRLKGKANPLPLFTPLGMKEGSLQKGDNNIKKQGRDTEYRLIRSLVAKLLLYHRGGTLMLLGGRGSGKAVLVKALEEYARLGQLLLLVSRLDGDKDHDHLPPEGGAPSSCAPSASRQPVGRRKSARTFAQGLTGGANANAGANAGANEGAGADAEAAVAPHYRAYRPAWFSEALSSLSDQDEARLGIEKEQGLGFQAWRPIVRSLLGSAQAGQRLGGLEP